MRIAIVTFSDSRGGASKAAFRLHQSLVQAGEDSWMIVQQQYSSDVKVIGPQSKVDKLISSTRSSMDSWPLKQEILKKNGFFSVNWVPFDRIRRKLRELKPDVIHMHWICGGMLRIESLAKLDVPVVWSLHDMWPFTGGCHYDNHCGKYMDVCGNCPILESSRPRDLSRWIFNRKKKTYSRIDNLTIVGLSHWMAECAKSSTLLSTRPVHYIPNPIDTELFNVINKHMARELFKLPKDKKLILFAAANPLGDPRKGSLELVQMLEVYDEPDTECVILGARNRHVTVDIHMPVHYVDTLHDEVSLVALYNACDVTILPSRQENLSNIALESLACGTPVVAFDIGGNRDMVLHKKTGYIAKPFDHQDLKSGTIWVLDESRNKAVSCAARETVLDRFDQRQVVQQYIRLYKDIISRWTGSCQ